MMGFRVVWVYQTNEDEFGRGNDVRYDGAGRRFGVLEHEDVSTFDSETSKR